MANGQAPQPQAQGDVVEKTFGFDGAWMPDYDPSKMGEENFSTLENFRYVEDGIEVIDGYTKLTTNPMNATYKYPRDAIHFRQRVGTNDSFVLVFAWDNVPESATAARVLNNSTAIGTAGDFDAAVVDTPVSPVDPRFAHLPRGIALCTGSETSVWEGEEADPGIVVLGSEVTNLVISDPRDYSSEMVNSLDTANQILTCVAATGDHIVVGTTRPISGIKFYIKTASTVGAAVTSVSYWDGTAWQACTNQSDGTQAVAGQSMTQTGSITFDSTESTAKQSFIDNVYLYHYVVSLNSGIDAVIKQITVNMPMQNAVNIWDGVYRTCINYQVQINGSAYQDYTLEVNEESNVDYPITAKMQNFRQNAADVLLVAFEERTSAIRVEILGGKHNTDAATLVVKYWSGTAWVDVTAGGGALVDGTLAGGKTFNQSGVISWSSPTQSAERARTLFGVSGYFYQITTTAQWTGDVEVDFMSGIPAPEEVLPHKFPAKFSDRAVFGGPIDEPNALDYTATLTIDVHNGLDSSARGQRLYIGSAEEVTAARSVYNRFGSSIYETLLIFKNDETHLLTGTGPADFRVFRVSENYGCPAPRTLVGAEVGYQMGGGAYRNVVMWMSYRGPVIFDGAVIMPIPGIDLYFDTRKDTTINEDYIKHSVAWFDPFWKEYHLLIPSGTATKINTHLVYDLTRKKWWKVVYNGGSSDVPQYGLIVTSSGGIAYPYVFRDDGHMLRFGSGTDWAGNDLTHKVKTADILPGGMWNLTQLNMLKIGHQVPDFLSTDSDITMTIKMYINGVVETVDATSLSDFVISVSNFITETDILQETGVAADTILVEGASGDHLIYDKIDFRRYVRYIEHLDQAVHSVAFEFSRTSTSSSYQGNFGKSFLWWGFRGKIVGEDLRGDNVS